MSQQVMRYQYVSCCLAAQREAGRRVRCGHPRYVGVIMTAGCDGVVTKRESRAGACQAYLYTYYCVRWHINAPRTSGRRPACTVMHGKKVPQVTPSSRYRPVTLRNVQCSTLVNTTVRVPFTLFTQDPNKSHPSPQYLVSITNTTSTPTHLQALYTIPPHPTPPSANLQSQAHRQHRASTKSTQSTPQAPALPGGRGLRLAYILPQHACEGSHCNSCI
jgi:hypothetical protein